MNTRVILQIWQDGFKEILQVAEKISELEESRLGELEHRLGEVLRRVGQCIGQAILDGLAEKERRRSEFCPACRGRAENHGSYAQEIETEIGVLKVRKRYFLCKHCGERFVPEQKRYGLWWGNSSERVMEEMVERSLHMSFRKVSMELKRRGLSNKSHETIRQLVHSTGRLVKFSGDWKRRILLEKQLQGSENDENKVFYGMWDGTCVNTVEDGWREVKIGLIMDEQKHQKVYSAGFCSWEELGEELREIASLMGVRACNQMVCIGDGASWVKRIQERFFPTSRFILDFYHALEHIGECSREVYGEGTEKGRKWYERCREKLYLYGGEHLCGYLRRWKGQLCEEKKESAGKLLNYLEPRVDCMDYPRYRSEGLEIGSGDVESACKNVIGYRLKRGKRWRLGNAEAMLNLLCVRNSFPEQRRSKLCVGLS